VRARPIVLFPRRPPPPEVSEVCAAMSNDERDGYSSEDDCAAERDVHDVAGAATPQPAEQHMANAMENVTATDVGATAIRSADSNGDVDGRRTVIGRRLSRASTNRTFALGSCVSAPNAVNEFDKETVRYWSDDMLAWLHDLMADKQPTKVKVFSTCTGLFTQGIAMNVLRLDVPHSSQLTHANMHALLSIEGIARRRVCHAVCCCHVSDFLGHGSLSYGELSSA
jgi:hypothetical protein